MKKKKYPSQWRRETKRREACDKEVAGKVADKEIPSSKETLKVAEKKVTHWQTKHWLSGLRPGRPVDNGPQEGDYSAWVAWEKGKVEIRKTSQGAQFSLSSRLPRQNSPPPVAHYLQGALA